MAIVLKLGSNGNLERLGTGDSLEINVISARTTSSAITIGANLDSDQKVSIGSANVDTEVLRDLILARDILPGLGVGSLGTGVTQYVDQAWVQAVNDNGPDAVAYNLAAFGTSAGAYSIGIDASLIAQTSKTDLMSALADMSTAIAGASVAQDTLPIQNGVTIAVGDCVALSLSVSGRIAKADAVAGSEQNPELVGIAATGGTGDSGGTVTCTYTLLGQPADVTGATYTPGTAVYVPVGGGIPVSTAPSTVGQLVLRAGWASTATRVILDAGTAVVL